jgi:hypothetical protein
MNGKGPKARSSKGYRSSQLDQGIRREVEVLWEAGIETFESCQGGAGHSSPEPVVRFHGQWPEGLKALSAALYAKLRVHTLQRVWRIEDGEPVGPWWEITFWPENRPYLPSASRRAQ